MRDTALARLEWLLRDASRPDPDQWRPEHEYLEGALSAYERIGVLSSAIQLAYEAAEISPAARRTAGRPASQGPQPSAIPDQSRLFLRPPVPRPPSTWSGS